MRIIVTGATGFLGSKLVLKLAEKHEVLALTRSGADEALPGLQAIACDLCENFDISALPNKIDSIVHLAQSRRYREFPESADDMFAVNVLGTYNLLEYARKAGAKNFVLASTGSVYAPSPNLCHEDTAVAPTDFYAASKLAAENISWPYEAFMKVSALRLFYVYGPGQTDKLVAGLVNRIKADQALKISGSKGGVALNPTFIDDVVSVFMQAVEQSWDGVYNVASAEAVTIRELGQAIAKALNTQVKFEISGGDEPISVLPDLSRLDQRVNTSSFIGLDEGLKKMLLSGE